MKSVSLQLSVWWLTWKHLQIFQESFVVRWLPSSIVYIIHAVILPNCTHINKEALWPKLYQFQISTHFAEKWCLYLTSLQVPTDPVFHQHYTGIIFNNLVKQNVPSTEEKDMCVNPLTFEEENAIRYVGGYVLKCLKEGEKDKEAGHQAVLSYAWQEESGSRVFR